jgi:hypothetical protein
MGTFNEADHPRDDEGKFTYKGGIGSSRQKSNEEKMQNRANILYNSMNEKDNKNMHINKNGDLDLLITDVYDFNNDKNASDLVKVGRDRQEKGGIIPYFYIYHVIIPKNLKLNDSKRK